MTCVAAFTRARLKASSQGVSDSLLVIRRTNLFLNYVYLKSFFVFFFALTFEVVSNFDKADNTILIIH